MKSNTSKADKLQDRTLKIIKRGGRILLKKEGNWYLHAWTNVAAGWDKAVWGKKNAAMEFMDLSLAFAIAPHFKAKVVVLLPKRIEKNSVAGFTGDSIPVGGHTCAIQALR